MCMYVYIYIHIFVYVYMCQTARWPDQEGAGSVRFVSVPDFEKIERFGSVRPVRFGYLFLPARQPDGQR